MKDSGRAEGFRTELALLLLCLAESRPAVLGIFLLRFLTAGAVGLTSVVSFPPSLLVGAAVWFCSVSFTYLYNGVTDVGEDRANGSRRPIARGALPVACARRTAWALAVLALCGGAALGPVMLAATACMILLGYAYSVPGIALKRRTPSTIAVVVASGALTYTAGWSSGTVPSSSALLVFSTAMCLWMGMVGAAAKDFSDAEGDARHGRRNWTVLWGRAVTACIVSLSAVAIGAGLLAVATVLDLPELLAPGAVVLTGALALSAVALSARRGDSRARRRLPYRIFMITQYAAHLVTLHQPIA
ncbi:UbiA family prenyltransferase [Streptomyces chitinivorans]|uniref:UbiA family prenyltransferase n=1 Tax=Streptomyces chitinivorans TaxID=1257027 RepID=A0ABW7HT74_9ACTN|nr:UbiA family prenyltransferase [Streptomyces chitinivorans]MDH2407809.1 UbiA family prenyltransferase [Streptomyces chitinivorans]